MVIKDLEILKKRSLIGVIIIFVAISIFRIYNALDIYNENKTEQKNSIFKQTCYIYNAKLNIINSTFINRLQSIISQQTVKDAIKNRDRETLYKLSLERFETIKKDFPTLKRMHYHLPDNTSLLRIHKPKQYGDNLKEKRPMIAEAIETKSIQVGFESGLYDKAEITYRVAIPIMDGDTLLSIIELGIDVKYILKKLDNFFKAIQMEKVYIGFLLQDKNLTKSKNMDLNDYRLIANDTSVSLIINRITSSKIEQNIKFQGHDYFVFWGKDKLKDFNNDQVGTIFYAFDITKLENNFNHSIILSIVQPLMGMTILLLIFLSLFNYIIKQSKQNYIKVTSIVDNQKAIIVVTNGKKIILTNLSFLNFFNIDSMDTFLKKYNCICDKFENQDGYLQKNYGDKNWMEFIMLKPNQIHKVKIIDEDGKSHTFQVNAKEFTQENNMEYVVSFEDITILEYEIYKNQQKDRQLLQQSRLAQMGEMISMIAHQWRQPLAAISSTSASLELKAKLNKLDNDIVIELSNNISQYSQHLSSTIDDFREFFKTNKEKKEVSYNELILSVLNIVEDSIVNKNIKIITKLDCDYKLHTYPNEVKQVILNLIKNAEDVLIEKDIKNPTITIQTSCEINCTNPVLLIGDNGGGISKDIIDKIFDPYFSTKTKKDGTGLGLYMSKTIIEEHCGGRLSVANGKDGAVFMISLTQ